VCLLINSAFSDASFKGFLGCPSVREAGDSRPRWLVLLGVPRKRGVPISSLAISCEGEGRDRVCVCTNNGVKSLLGVVTQYARPYRSIAMAAEKENRE
jgi:hypothetical protein